VVTRLRSLNARMIAIIAMTAARNSMKSPGRTERSAQKAHARNRAGIHRRKYWSPRT
jgi:hypothetical protein